MMQSTGRTDEWLPWKSNNVYRLYQAWSTPTKIFAPIIIVVMLQNGISDILTNSFKQNR